MAWGFERYGLLKTVSIENSRLPMTVESCQIQGPD
jgi:hypothetical protein